MNNIREMQKRAFVEGLKKIATDEKPACYSTIAEWVDENYFNLDYNREVGDAELAELWTDPEALELMKRVNDILLREDPQALLIPLNAGELTNFWAVVDAD